MQANIRNLSRYACFDDVDNIWTPLRSLMGNGMSSMMVALSGYLTNSSSPNNGFCVTSQPPAINVSRWQRATYYGDAWRVGMKKMAWQ